MADFSSILDQQVNSVERPKPYPIGMYHCIVDGPPEVTQIGANKTDCAIFPMKIMSAQLDVDLADIEAAGGVTGKIIRHRLFLTADAAWRLDQFLFEHLGIEFGKSRKEAISEAVGRQCFLTIRHRPAQDGSAMFAEVASTAHI